MASDRLEELLAEQVAYYRARAGEYDASTVREGAAWAALTAALRRLSPFGDVLEFACGTGAWTGELCRLAARVTALDASPEMLAIAAGKLEGRGVRFIEADVFGWRPDRRYDLVFFAAWLSHVPPQRFASFWSLVADCVAPGGRVFAIDEGPAGAADELLVPNAAAPAVLRPLSSGAEFRAIKVFHEPVELERRLAGLGWKATARFVDPRFFYLVAEPRVR